MQLDDGGLRRGTGAAGRRALRRRLLPGWSVHRWGPVAARRAGGPHEPCAQLCWKAHGNGRNLAKPKPGPLESATTTDLCVGVTCEQGECETAPGACVPATGQCGPGTQKEDSTACSIGGCLGGVCTSEANRGGACHMNGLITKCESKSVFNTHELESGSQSYVLPPKKNRRLLCRL